MSKEEEAPTRVTRGALRRMSVDQDPPSAPGTPKKTAAAAAATSKKLAVLDAIQEGSNGPSDAEVEEDDATARGAAAAAKGKKDTSLVANRSVHRLNEQSKKPPPTTTSRSRAASLTQENVEQMESLQEIRRTPRRRPSQDQTTTTTTTPQTVPKRMTRRNSVTSDDGNLSIATPKASRTRLSVAPTPAVIIEDVEKEEQANVSIPASTAEADLSDLDIRKLRNRSISNSPVPRGSPCSKSASMTTLKDEEIGTSPTKGSSEISSPVKIETAAGSSVEMVEEEASESLVVDLVKSPSAISVSSSSTNNGEEVKRAVRDVTFEEGTPDQLSRSKKYPKTPIAASGGERRRKLSELTANESLTMTSEVIVINETIKDSPQEAANPKTPTPKSPAKTAAGTPKKAAEVIIIDETIKDSPLKTGDSKSSASPKTPAKASGTPKKASADESIDTSLANIVEQVREDMNQTDLSMSILGTPKPLAGGKHKSHFSHLREGSSSTPIAAKHAALEEIPEEEQKSLTVEGSPASKSWGQAVKGSGKDKGIDVFSVRKQEEEAKQEEEVKTLNESLKRKSLEKKRKSLKVEEEDDEEEDGEEEEEEEDVVKSSFVDDEAMEVDDYESGDSMDSETRKDMEDNAALEQGESLGSEDTDLEGEEDEDDDSFIASDGEEEDDLLDGTGDDLHSEEEEKDGKKGKKKQRKRIIQQEDSSEEEGKTVITLDETNASESKSPKRKRLDSSKTDSPKKTPGKSAEANSPKKTPAKKTSDGEEVEETHKKTPKKDTSLQNVQQSPKSAKKTPAKVNASQEVTESPKSAKKTPAKITSPQEVPESPKSPKKTPSKPAPEVESKKADEASDAAAQSRKSVPAPALIGADFYSSSAKKAKRNEEPKAPEEIPSPTIKEQLSNLVTNPAALALARKNKRLSQGLSPDAATKQDRRASLPGKLPVEREVDSPLKKKSTKAGKKEEKQEGEKQDAVEPMEVDEDEDEEVEVEPSPKKPVVTKKKPKDLSEFDTEAILSRCNEIVREDKQKRKEGATLRQKKKDEKRRQREQEKQEEAAEGEAEQSPEQPKKKKKKKKQVNYLLEELGETKEDQVARALQRKMALLEAKRERKKAKKAEKLRQQLNKENQQEEEKTAEGIAAKLEKKAKKAKKVAKEAEEPVLEEPKPVVKRAVSAFAMYSEQIEELKKAQKEKKKPKSKQLKEKNQQPTAVEEVQAALQPKCDTKAKKDKSNKQKQAKAAEEASAEVVVQAAGEHSKADKKKDVTEKVAEAPAKEVQKSEKQKKKAKPTAVVAEEPAPKKKKLEQQVNTAPLKSISPLDGDDLAELKKSLSDPVTKAAKKQKLAQKESKIDTAMAREVTPPPKPTTGKLKALSRLEAGFQEEPLTPDHKLLKRNHGFQEEPVTPKSVGFKVSSVLPAGQEALKQEAVVAKKKKTHHNTNRIRPEDVKEPVRGLAQPVWTRSGSFEVEELAEAKSKKGAKNGGDYVPLSVNGGGHSSTEFLVKPLGGGGKSKKEDKASGSKAHRIDVATVDDAVINFKKQAIFGKNAHLREKKSKH